MTRGGCPGFARSTGPCWNELTSRVRSASGELEVGQQGLRPALRTTDNLTLVQRSQQQLDLNHSEPLLEAVRARKTSNFGSRSGQAELLADPRLHSNRNHCPFPQRLDGSYVVADRPPITTNFSALQLRRLPEALPSVGDRPRHTLVR